MSAISIENAVIVRPGHGLTTGCVLVADGKIAAIEASPPPDVVPCERIDAEGGLLTPGLVDIHTHGIHEFLYERGPDDILAGAAVLPRVRHDVRAPNFVSCARSPLACDD